MSIKVDLSPKASLNFTREKEEVQACLKARKSIVFHLGWGDNPFDGSLELYRFAFEQFKKELLNSAVKEVNVFPLDRAFFEGSLQEREQADFLEEGYSRIDLFRRDQLSAFLNELPLEGVPAHLSIEGPKWWLHPTKFPWLKKEQGVEKIGLLLPNIETDEVLTKFESMAKQGNYRLLTEETLALEWEGLEVLWYIPEGVTKMGMRVLRGFEAAGGELKNL